MRKKILVISYYANMPGACQAEWIDDRIKAFIEKGYEITLISSICCHKFSKPINHYRVPSLSFHSFNYEFAECKSREIQYHGLINFLFSSYSLIARLLGPLLYFIRVRSGEGRWSWFLTSFWIAIMDIIRGKSSYDFIYTTGGPASAHLVGIFISPLNRRGRTLCELQDPLTGENIGRNKISKLGFHFIEKFIVRFSGVTIYCTAEASRVAKNKYKSSQKKIDFVYPGAYPVQTNNNRNENLSSERNKVIEILYLGSLYQSRNFDTLMEALYALVAELGPDVLKKIQITTYGHMNTDIRERIAAFRFDVFNMNSLVPREVALQKASETDILLLIQNSDKRSTVTIPFKTYDYLQQGKLILGLIYRNKELKQMLESKGHLTCEVDSVEEIKNILKKIIFNFSSYDSAIIKSDLTPNNAVAKMIQLVSHEY